MEKELINTLLKELFEMEELHEEYQDNDTHFAIDVQKEDENTLNVKIVLKDNKDKKEFEAWVNDLDDEIFNETWESLSDEFGLKDLNEAYNSDDYIAVIDKFKERAKEVINNKISCYQRLLKD